MSTFDRVLLYLEHEARGEVFHFDPLLVNDLLDASIKLKIAGLKEICERVIGSFEERLRREPIRLDEVIRRNEQGKSDINDTGKRKETLLIMSGMVLDITHWLDEHPGGSTIIPEQALNVDSTVFFEIYHASRQSFLYLKEFYIGELAMEDREKIPLPTSYGQIDTKASDAFMEQLGRMTSWRLRPEDLRQREFHQSF